MRWRAILVVLAAFPSFVKAEVLPIKTYTAADGLASDRVNRIVADSRGFLWFCTPEGLSRFDGNRFVNYGAGEGLPDPFVLTLRETGSGDRWIGTAKGLSRIAAGDKGARLKTFAMGKEPGHGIVAIVESRSGKILVATNTGVFEAADTINSRLDFVLPAGSRITDMTEDSGGNLWIGTPDGVFIRGTNGVLQGFSTKNGLPGNWVENLLSDSKGRMWAALRGGLVQFRPNGQGQWVVEKIYSAALAGQDVKAVTEASDGTLWVGTTRGISRLKWEHDGPPVVENLSRAQGLSDRSITALAEDQAGNIWAGTESAGVMKIGRIGFTTYHEQDGLRSDRVWSLLEGRAGELLAVTIPQDLLRARSLDIFDGTRFHSIAPGAFADHGSWVLNKVLLQSRTGEWWTATNRGLCRFEAVPAAKLDGRQPQACYVADTAIFSIFEDSKGGIWASARSAQGDRLMRWNSETNSVFEFPYPRVDDARQGLPDDLVSAFAEDRQGNIWMGLYKGGLYRYNGVEFQLLQQKENVPGGSILTLLATGSGLWIGSDGGGLGRIRNIGDARPAVEIYDTVHGMSSNIVACLVEDRDGHIYAGTGKGVDRLDPVTGHVRRFSSADGVAHGEFHYALRDRSGNLWFATTQGLSRLVPGDDRKPQSPRILITDLRIGGEAWSISQLGETRIVVPDLPPSQNQLQVDFVGIDYEPGDSVRYSYKLEGADSKWSTPRLSPTVSYAALASGRYRFLVKAVTSEGVESAPPAEIDFLVLPPFWKRWWFVSLAAALLIAVGIAGHRYRVAQIVGLERMRTAIATDLHDDIGASLSQIAILSEVARVSGNRKDSAERLERVATLARELVDSMGDIVWSIRSEPHGLESLIRHMREFAFDVLTSQGIHFELHTPPYSDGLQIGLQVRRQLFLMFKECIHNIARHSRCTSVVAELKTVNRELILTVEDNGIGVDSAQVFARRGGTGIPGMHARARSLGGRMQWTSIPGQGCRVEIHLPIRVLKAS